jgi:hypothetical protein
MTNASMTPGSRPRRGVIGVLALLGAGVLTTGLVLAAGEAGDPPRVAGAVELATFTSCDDLAAWGEEMGGGGGDDSMDGDVAMAGAEVAEVAEDSGGEAGAPVAASPTTMAPPLSTTAPATEPEADEPEAEGADEPSEDETNVAVEGVDEIDLVDRLTEDVVLVASATRLAVVDLVAAEVVEAVTVPWDAQVTYDAEAGVAWVVGHPDGGGVAVERYAVDVEGLEVEGSWTTTGSLVDARRVGDELHVVATDGFVAMPASAAAEGDLFVEDDPDAPTSDAGPVPFSGGPVPCDEVLHPVGPSDPTATLLVTLPATGAVEPVRATEVVGSGSLVHVTTSAVYLATPQWSDAGTRTGIHRFDLATLEPTGSGEVEGSMLDEFSLSEHDGVLRVATTHDGGRFGVVEGDVGVASDVAPVPPTTTPISTTTEVPDPADALNEIVILDTDGALDVVGRTERFGHPGETLHGIRFAGTVAYAVTFLQTDPFYVVDLADPAAPQVVGEVELPGFSSYLHPLGGGLVVGFGPGGDGRPAAKLFDVSDPTRPAVVGELVLGDDTTVAYDHHAYLDLGDGRFAVPAADYDISEELVADGGGRESVAGGIASSVVVVDTSGGRLVEEARHTAVTTEMATRVLTVGDGWALLAGPEIVTLDAAGEPVGRISL